MLCFVFSALVVVLDQLFKRYITITMTLYETKTLIPGLVGITYVQNPNAALSIYIGGRWVLAAIMFVCIIILIAILLRYNEGFWGTLGLAAALGGAVGNLIDRVFIGEVIDMFEFQFVNFAVFNIADIFVTLGGLTFCIFFIVSSFKSSGKRDDALDSAHSDAHAAMHAEPEPAQIEPDYLSDYDYEDSDDYSYANDDPDDDDYTVQDTRPKPYLRPMTPVDEESIRQTRHVLSPFEIDTPPVERAESYDTFEIARTVESASSAETAAQIVPQDSPSPASDPAGEASSLLDELELLESDFIETDIYQDDDVDELLREYGFDSD